MQNESIIWCIQNCAAYVMSEDAQVELNNITARIAELETHVENANIAAKSLQIQNVKLIREVARLTAGSEAMQEDAANNTITIKMLMAQLAELKAPIEDIKYYVGNPSAWKHYDDEVSEKIRAILKAAGMA